MPGPVNFYQVFRSLKKYEVKSLDEVTHEKTQTRLYHAHKDGWLFERTYISDVSFIRWV